MRQSLFFNKACNFIEKKALPQVFSCEFRQISKNIFFTEHLPATASAASKNMILRPIFLKKIICWERR